MTKPLALVVGVGAEQGLGAALCRRFAASGHHVVVVGRTLAKVERVTKDIEEHGGSAEAYVADASVADDVAMLFEHVFGSRQQPATTADVVIFNSGGNWPIKFLDLTPEKFEEFWRSCCFAGFLVGQEAIKRLEPLERGTLIFTGASGSMRGKPHFAHFAAAKGGLRMLAQSLAREFGAKGIHVAHVVIDGGIKGERLVSAHPQVLQERGEDGLLDIDAIADTYHQLHSQHRSAWTHELDLRPYREAF